MPITRQDIAVIVLHYLQYSLVRNYIFKFTRRPVARILVLHDVLPSHAHNLYNNLSFLKYNTNVISLDDFVNNRLTSNTINTIITFDDGFKGWITYALPILKQLHLPAAFFISSGFLGLNKSEENSFLRNNLSLDLLQFKVTGGLSESDLRFLVDEGYIIGGHTRNHCRLDSVYGIENLQEEIQTDKKRLEELANAPIRYFSYPMGLTSNPHHDIKGILIKSGYKAAVSLLPGFNTMATDPYLLHRDITGAGMSIHAFKARVFGNYDFVTFIKNILHRLTLLRNNLSH